MITFAKYLFQSRAVPLYHATLAQTAAQILTENRLRIGHRKPNPGGHGAQISFTRDLLMANQWGTVILELDQQKVRSRYKVVGYRTPTHIFDVVKKDISPLDQVLTKIIVIVPTLSDTEKEISFYTEEYPQIINDRRFHFYDTQSRRFVRVN